METNSARFIRAYNALVDEMKSMVNFNQYIPFYRLIEMTKKQNGLIMKYKDDLKEIGELRNAIVHDRGYPEYAIAEPHDDIVEKLEYILQELQNPKTLFPLFKCNVVSFQQTDRIVDVLKAIKQYAYSQFPIYDGTKYLGILTDRGITNWVANHVDDSFPSVLQTVKVAEVLGYEKKKTFAGFIEKRKTIYDARVRFIDHMEKHNTRLEAVFITENGKSNEPLLGMVTPADLIQLME